MEHSLTLNSTYTKGSGGVLPLRSNLPYQHKLHLKEENNFALLVLFLVVWSLSIIEDCNLFANDKNRANATLRGKAPFTDAHLISASQ